MEMNAMLPCGYIVVGVINASILKLVYAII